MVGALERADRKPILVQVYRWVGRVLGWVLAALAWPVRTIWGEQQPVLRGPSIAVLAIAAWSALTAAFAVLG